MSIEQQRRRQALDEAEHVGVQQLSLIYGGLIVIGVYFVQPFLTAASLDLSARVSVVAFSVAIPLLAALVLVNRLEVIRRHLTRSMVVSPVRVVALICAFVGVVAGFWHILWIAGVGILVSGLVGAVVASVGWRLGRDQMLSPRGEASGNTES